jgi:hypothetical protein
MHTLGNRGLLHIHATSHAVVLLHPYTTQLHVFILPSTKFLLTKLINRAILTLAAIKSRTLRMHKMYKKILVCDCTVASICDTPNPNDLGLEYDDMHIDNDNEYANDNRQEVA